MAGTKTGDEPVMRTVSFVEHIDLDFKGNVITQTMLLADVDNDMANELIVGNLDGQVAIFKGDSGCQPWRKFSLSGMLTCLSVGEVFVGKKNSLVCMTAEGWCYVYHISSLSASLPQVSIDEVTEKPVLTQELPANAKVMCLADIDNDGHIEMVIGYSDRVVRAFRWHESFDPQGGHFILVQKWQLAGQIGSITMNHKDHGHSELMVSQPGATFVSLKVRPSIHQVRSEGQLNANMITTTTMSALRLTHGHGHHLLERSGSFAGASNSRPNSSLARLNLSAQSIDLAGMQDSPGFVNQSDNVSTYSDISYRSLENISLKALDGGGTTRRSSRPDLQKSVSDADQPTTNRKGQRGPSHSQSHGSSEEDLFNPSLVACSSKHRSATKPGGSVEKLAPPGGAKTTASNTNSGGGGESGEISSIGGVKKTQRSVRHSNELLDVFLDSCEDISIVYHPLASHVTRNADSSTLMIGSIKSSGNDHHTKTGTTTADPEGSYYAIATLDGSLTLADRDNILWSLQVQHELFALAKLDITGDGKEEVIGCSWNGQTYIVNHKKEVVCFHFPNSVSAFCAGYYSVDEKHNVPCFVYATTNHHLYIYHNIRLPHLESTNLMQTMATKTTTNPLLHKLGVKADDHASLRQVYHWCLYGQRSAS